MSNTLQIPNHTIIRQLGEGGMGTVYLGVDNTLQRQVAIKELKSMREEDRKRFQAEAFTLAKLHHPGITLLYNLLQEDDRWYMIMEYVEGETLESLLKKGGSLSVRKVLEIAVRTLDGLQHAHDRGVIHRDLKPSNLMLSDGGVVKIMDFGIARIAGNVRLTRDGRVVGTVQYMSPEQVNGREVGYASDIYSLGIVLYELLTGIPPFDGGNEFEIMRAQTGDKPLPPDRINRNIPKALNAAILKALAKEPSARFADAGEFKRCLEQIAGQPVENPVPKWKFQALKLPKWKFPALKLPKWKIPALKPQYRYAAGIGFLTVSLFVMLFVLFDFPKKTPPVETHPVEEVLPPSPSGPERGLSPVYTVTPDPVPELIPVKDDPKPETGKDKPKPKPKPETLVDSPSSVLNVTLNGAYDYDSTADNTAVTLSVSGSFVRQGQVVVANGAKAHGVIRKAMQSKELLLMIRTVESTTGQELKVIVETRHGVNFPQGTKFQIKLID